MPTNVDRRPCPHRDDEACSVCTENESLRSRIAALEEQLAGSVTYLQAIDLLNEALRLDPGAIEELIATRVPCNAELAAHPTIQCGAIVLKGKPVPGTETVGLLGILNGIFGLQPDGSGWGWIAADASKEDHRTLHRFKVATPPVEHRSPRFIGSDSERQSVGDPGHCERCVEVGHVAAHPDLGCGDVGCDAAHGPGDPP